MSLAATVIQTFNDLDHMFKKRILNSIQDLLDEEPKLLQHALDSQAALLATQAAKLYDERPLT